MLLGDFNGHSPRWGSDHLNPQGKIIEELLDDLDLCVLNDGSPTYLSPGGTSSPLDLAICDPSIFLDLEWKVHSDLCGSDHFPTFLKILENIVEPLPDFWNFKKANWDLFKQLTEINISSKVLEETDPVLSFSKLLIQCAKDSIPKPRTINKLKTPWFDEDCKKIHKERKQALRKFNKNPTLENKQAHQKLRAKTRYIFKQKRRESWRSFCSRLSGKTSSKKVWKVIHRIKGKASKDVVQCLKKNGITISDKKQVANLLASTINFNSSSNHCPEQFRKIKCQKESIPCSFYSNNTEVYNQPFTIEELKDAILKSNNSASGPDDIHYQLITHLPIPVLKLLLEVFNTIWSSGSFPPSWRKAVIIPIPKPGKDHSDPNNYRPIALTS